MKIRIFLFLLYLLAILLVYRVIFTNSLTAGGDYITLWPDHISLIRNNAFFSWDPTINLGVPSIDTLHSSPFNIVMGTLGGLVGNNIILIERLFWWIPFLTLSFISSTFLFKKLFSSTNFLFLSPLIFLFNTYVLMMIGGGQIAGVGLAYAIAPLVLGMFISLVDKFYAAEKFEKLQLLRKSLVAGLLLAVLVMFDYRITYITVFAEVLFLLVNILSRNSKKNLRSLLFLLIYTFVIPFGITGLLHAFWLLPTLFVKNDVIQQLGPAFTSLQSVSFFSFAKFENTISLLHPNWPENIFGKVSFMKPEFLLVPILAYASLLFVNNKNKKESFYVLFFALLGLFGAYLAKGTNDPFGSVYLWLFQHVPGFIMFRDSTKWYTLVAISYSVLIPFTIWNTYDWLKRQKNVSQFKFQNIFLLVIVCYLLFLIRPALFGQLGGTFKVTTVPNEYDRLKDFLASDKQFSRVLWVPEKQRFGFWSNIHPSIWTYDFFHTTSISGTVAILKNKNAQQILQEAAIKYVIVPFDSQGEIFLKDRKYDENAYLNTIQSVDKISWLTKINGFGNIGVYKVANPKERFWSPTKNMGISYSYVNPTQYEISIINAKKGNRLIFAESFDKYWEAKSDGRNFHILSEVYDRRFNSFVLAEDGNYTLEVTYTTQKWVVMGLVISLTTLFLVVGSFVILRKRL